MDVADAKQAFLNWNEKSLNNLIEQYESDQQPALKVIPLLFQINDLLLPGYSGADTPAGIYGYKPVNSVIDAAKQFNRKFSYRQDFVLKNTIIESIYLQKTVLDNKLFIWLVCIDKLKSKQTEELRAKLEKIVIWLKSRGIEIEGQLLRVSRLAKKSKPQSIFLDGFYLESILLAGKYPVWWLVPPEKESDYSGFVSHIKKARFVNEDEFIDIGHVAELNHDDFIRLSIKHAQKVYQQPENSYLNLLLLQIKQQSWPEINGMAWQLKSKIYSGHKNIDELYASSIVVALLQYAMDNFSSPERQLMPYSKLFSLLSKYARDVSGEVLDDLSDRSEADVRGLEVTGYLSLYEALFSEIRRVYHSIFTKYDEQTEGFSEKLKQSSKNMLIFLSDKNDRVSVFNIQQRTEFILNRMLLRHIIKPQGNDIWELIIELEEGEEKVINEFNSILALISWAWLNRIVDQSTQVSIDCPSRVIKQTEAYHVLEVLTQNISPDLVSNTTKRDFEQDSRPLKSILFLNFVFIEGDDNDLTPITSVDDPLSYGVNSKNLITHCEQLIAYDWGDVYTRQYSGDDGVLQCLCDWMKHAPLSRGVQPQELHCFGYAAGDSTYIAQRIDQVYDELIEFFYHKKHLEGRFILKMGPEYYFVEAKDDVPYQQKIGSQTALYSFLEQANKEYCPYALERFVLAETPLREIFKRNKKNVVQVFFRINNRVSETWVVDEKGSLWYEQQDWFDRSSYVAHWLYLMRNIRNKLKTINYQKKELPQLEIKQISVNQLGGMDFHPLGAETVSAERSFIDIHIKINAKEDSGLVSLICDGKNFDASVYGDQVVSECMRHTAERMIEEGKKPVYITDMDVPLRVFGVEDKNNIQVLHFLKYKRTFEKLLNQLLNN